MNLGKVEGHVGRLRMVFGKLFFRNERNNEFLKR